MPELPLSREPAAANWFIGLEVPPLAAWDGLTQGLPDGMRRFIPPDRHLTLAFLGSCGTERAGRAWSALAGLRHAPIIATAAAWRAMGPRGRPSAYAITLAMGRGTAAALDRAIECSTNESERSFLRRRQRDLDGVRLGADARASGRGDVVE